MDFKRGTFRAKGDILEIYPSNQEESAIRVEFWGDEVERISEINPLTGKTIATRDHVMVYPNSHYVTSKDKLERALETIEQEMEERVQYFKDNKKLIEAQRIEERTNFDIEMLKETGFCQGIENYSRHISGRPAGSAPYTLFDYFPDDFLILIDESHATIPQVRAMYNGDRARKDSLVNFGFRLPSAYDNRPLKFSEFEERINQCIFVSATPADYEKEHSRDNVVEQIIRPTGLLDPKIEVKPVENQIDDLITQINERVEKQERVLVTTLTKKMAEDLTAYLRNIGIRVRYMHSEIKALERNGGKHMAIRVVRENGDEILRKKSREVEKVDDKIREILDDMVETLHKYNGVGLAGPQIGILKRIIVIDLYDDKGPIKLINPVIIKEKGKHEVEEGCLSFPNQYGKIVRPEEVTIEALNENGEKVKIKAKELFAQAICHEVDHLNGEVFIDKIIPGTIEYVEPNDIKE